MIRQPLINLDTDTIKSGIVALDFERRQRLYSPEYIYKGMSAIKLVNCVWNTYCSIAALPPGELEHYRYLCEVKRHDEFDLPRTICPRGDCQLPGPGKHIECHRASWGLTLVTEQNADDYCDCECHRKADSSGRQAHQ